MIIRKPYAFLIKNFKKIHIFLLLLAIFVAYKLFDVNSYVNEFMRLGTYDMFGDPISKHIDIWLNLSIFLLVVGSTSLLFLLYYKKKPWKIYLIPCIEYFSLFIVLRIIKGFFNSYSISIETTDLRLSRDLLFIFIISQIIPIGIYLMRVFGLDTKKFQFNSDKEFLELKEEDREEIEVGLNFDKHSFIRKVKRLYRNMRYFYLEHRGICNALLVIVAVFSVYQIGRFFLVSNKSYSEGDSYTINEYTFRINKAYFTDKDFSGNVISNKSNFVIIDLSILNHAKARTIYLENFHLRGATEDYVTTRRTYAKEFQDLGTAYESTAKINQNETMNCIIIYKVNKNIKKNRFALYYQEKDGVLRKIKLNVQDISKIEEATKLSMGDEVSVEFGENGEVIRLDYAELSEKSSYTVRQCNTSNCNFIEKEFNASSGTKILEIDFSSDIYEVKNMLNFLENYAKIIYKNKDGEEITLPIIKPFNTAYYGKTVFLTVPAEVEEAQEIYLDFTVRNKHYLYYLDIA